MPEANEKNTHLLRARSVSLEDAIGSMVDLLSERYWEAVGATVMSAAREASEELGRSLESLTPEELIKFGFDCGLYQVVRGVMTGELSLGVRKIQGGQG